MAGQPKYNTALYLRLSKDDGTDSESSSIQTQKEMLTRYCRENGFAISEIYVDDGWSGTNSNRPSFQRMLSDIEDGKINCVITKDLSRLGRNYLETGGYTEVYFPEHQRSLHSRYGRRRHGKRLYNGHYAVQKSAQRYVRTGHLKKDKIIIVDAAETGQVYRRKSALRLCERPCRQKSLAD